MITIKCDICGKVQSYEEWKKNHQADITINNKEGHLCDDCERRLVKYVDKMKNEVLRRNLAT